MDQSLEGRSLFGCETPAPLDEFFQRREASIGDVRSLSLSNGFGTVVLLLYLVERSLVGYQFVQNHAKTVDIDFLAIRFFVDNFWSCPSRITDSRHALISL